MAILAKDKVIFNTSVVIWQILYILFQLAHCGGGGGQNQVKNWLVNSYYCLNMPIFYPKRVGNFIGEREEREKT